MSLSQEGREQKGGEKWGLWGEQKRLWGSESLSRAEGLVGGLQEGAVVLPWQAEEK